MGMLALTSRINNRFIDPNTSSTGRKPEGGNLKVDVKQSLSPNSDVLQLHVDTWTRLACRPRENCSWK
jgi:hypothetical protein